MLLDLLLPRRDGLAVLSELRKSRPTLPVIILTARGSEDDRVRGLRMGADDYVVKPFSARELLARVEAVMRRSPGRADGPQGANSAARSLISIAAKSAGPAANDANCPKPRLPSSAICWRIASGTVTRDDLLANVWGIAPHGLETRAIDMHVARLRAKLKDPSGSSDAGGGRHRAGPRLHGRAGIRATGEPCMSPASAPAAGWRRHS